jgi:hypothetical protein
MKMLRAIPIALVASSALTLAAVAAPAVTIDKAVALAQQSLRERGLADRVYIASATLERDSMLSAKNHWFVRWSESLPRPERKREIGVEVGMDGSVVILVKAPGQK